MSESIYLAGSDGVERAGYQMLNAADTMIRAADYFDEVFRRQQRFMDDWLERLQSTLETKHV
jgi:hypothetical protein